MTNAKKELLERIEGARNWLEKPLTIKCCEIRMEYYKIDDTSNEILLREGYTQEEYQEFLEQLDFEYDSGYGAQHLFGTVWLDEPGVWMERGEYDGSEWWMVNKCPSVPDYLKG